MYLGSEVDARLHEATEDMMGYVNSSKHREIIEYALADFGTAVYIQPDEEVDLKEIQVSGVFDPQKKRKNIEICLHYNPKSMRIVLTEPQWNRLRDNLSGCMQHELIHRNQWSRIRNKDCEGSLWDRYYKSYESDPEKIKTQEYLGEFMEIDAHAHDFMLEMKRNSKKTSPYVLLRNNRLIDTDKYPTFFEYLCAFNHDRTSPVMKKFFDRTRFWVKEEIRHEGKWWK